MLKNLIPEGKWSRITLLWSFSQFVVISIIECLILFYNMNLKNEWLKKANEAKIEDFKNNREIKNFNALIVYQILFIVALTYQLYLTVDTLLKFSTIDLIALAVFNSVCLVYSVTQYLQADRNNNDILKLIQKYNETYKIDIKKPETSYMYEYISIGIMIVYVIGWWYITFRLYKVFGWNVFKQIGADISLKNRLKLFNILFTLLKVSFFFIDCLFLVQYFALVKNPSEKDDNNQNKELIGKVPLAAIAVIGTILGFVAVAKQSRLCLAIYIFTLCVVIGFMCNVLVDMKFNVAMYEGSRICLMVTIICAVPLCLVTYGVSLINFKNFGLGIPKSINKNTTQTGQADRTQQKRLSID